MINVILISTYSKVHTLFTIFNVRLLQGFDSFTINSFQEVVECLHIRNQGLGSLTSAIFSCVLAGAEFVYNAGEGGH